ncbi:MAG TPA: glycyl-radical enzyme activating protein [Bacteroidales bacterium]|nr:glycyl-radical enzyme activating protein [Bacteroidales bacterium]HRZ20713.1 glycyl-radical enzyme activating protein [Bacteroidales bacterium]
MKGIIFDIKHYSINDGPGIRTTVFFKGCPLRCWWCHNPESQSRHEEVVIRERSLDGRSFTVEEISGRWVEAEEVIREIEKDGIYYDQSGGGITFSGGEPLMQPVFLLELLKMSKERGYHTALDTCGHVDETVLKQVMDHVDLFLYDLKLIDAEEHLKYTGVTNEKVLKNLILLSDMGKKIIIRIPVIPGITDTPKNITALSNLLTELNGLDRIDLLPYHMIAKSKYQRLNMNYKLEELQEPSLERLKELKEVFEGIGMKVTVGG